tara:strand:- start:8382 stop:8819 length:438 start_codon:yes stop_codon:yes gene_type:complete
MDYKKTTAARTTISRDIEELASKFDGNIYELIAILKQRTNQIGVEIKEELLAKLDEFATPSDTLEEVFENQEQTEISRFYERLPKPTLIAIQEILEDKVYTREQATDEEISLDQEITLEENDNNQDLANSQESADEKIEKSDDSK